MTYEQARLEYRMHWRFSMHCDPRQVWEYCPRLMSNVIGFASICPGVNPDEPFGKSDTAIIPPVGYRFLP